MFPAHTAVARSSNWRRPSVVLLTAFVVACLTLTATGAAVLGADNGQQSQPSTPPTLTPDQQRVENVIAAAKQYLGIPYRVGTEGPDLFDCSGLVFRAFSDAGLVDRVGGARLRAAGYMRWFAAKGMMTTDESQAQRGDLVVYNNGSHIGIYLGDGRVESALINPFGVTVHALHGVSLPVTGFLRPDWSGDGNVPPFVPVDLPDVPEAPATLVPAADWMPALDPAVVAPAAREGTERLDLRTLNSRTFENKDGTFTTEFHAQPIFYQPAGTTAAADLEPINLGFAADDKTGYASVTSSPVVLTARPANDSAGLLSATAGDTAVTLSLSPDASAHSSKSAPQIVDGGRVVDYFDVLPQGVGLRVMAQPDGFKSFIVMGKVPDDAHFSFALNAPGLTPAVADDGSVVLTDASGATLGRIPRPLLLDSSDIDGSGGGVFTAATKLSLDTSGATPVLTISVDRSYLDEAVMPAYLDLSLTEFPQVGAGADIAFASSGHPNASLHGFQRPESAGFDELWLGRQPGSSDDNGVFMRFSGLSSVLGNVDVASASLELLPYLQHANDAQTIVSRVTTDWNADALTWTTRPSVDDASAMTLTSTAGQWSSLDVSSYVADVLSDGAADLGLSLAADGSRAASWQRLAASDAGDAAEFGPRLVVTWSGLRPSGVAADVAAAPVPGAEPTLTWTNPQLAASQARFEVQVSHDGFTTIDVDSAAVKGQAGRTSTWAVPDGSLTTGGTYAWRVRAKFGADKAWSAWSTPQSFSYTSAITYVMSAHSAI
jgi:NlpC/P60 family protein